MNRYMIWCNLRKSHEDMEFSRAVAGYLGFLQEKGWIVRYRMSRRKFGFGPESLGEFQIEIESEDLATLDRAFNEVARRSGELERMHAEVYTRATDLKTALYRDFPDPQRASK